MNLHVKFFASPIGFTPQRENNDFHNRCYVSNISVKIFFLNPSIIHIQVYEARTKREVLLNTLLGIIRVVPKLLICLGSVSCLTLTLSVPGSYSVGVHTQWTGGRELTQHVRVETGTCSSWSWWFPHIECTSTDVATVGVERNTLGSRIAWITNHRPWKQIMFQLTCMSTDH